MPRRNRGQGGRDGGRRWGSARKRPRDLEEEPTADRPRRGRPAARTRSTPGDDTPALPVFPVSLLPEPAAGPVCGRCREWFADEVGGRGTCDHPGSGFLKPWSDTPACPFFHT